MAEAKDLQFSDQVVAARQAIDALALEIERFADARRKPEWSQNVEHDVDVAALRDTAALLRRAHHRKVGIAGQEGVGKSTLMNAIFGEEVVPTDDNQPGTAVAIKVCAVADIAPRYEIEVNGSAVSCTDYSEFVDYTLQRNNLNNAAQVTSARVSVPSHHLPPGLCLTDLPGSDGISTSMRADAIAAIEAVDAVILVVPDRNAGPAIQLAHEILYRGVAIDAVAINVQMSKLVDPSLLQSRAESEVHQHISTTRETVTRHFLSELPSLEGSCQFFAFHFPSMHDLSIASTAEHSSLAHTDEVDRFAKWLIASNGPHGEVARIRDALEDAAERIATSKQGLLREQELIDGLLNSRPTAHERIAEAIDHQRSVLREAWSKDVASGSINAAMKDAWRDFEPRIVELKTQLRALHRKTSAELPESWWSQNRQLSGQVSGDLKRSVDRYRALLDSRAQSCLQRFIDKCRDIAHRFAAAEVIIAPIDLGPLPLISAPSVSVWPGLEFNPQPQKLSEYDSARVVERLLDEVAVAEMTIDATESGVLSEAFHDALASIAKQIEAELAHRLDHLLRVVADRQAPELTVAAQRLVDQQDTCARLEESVRNVQLAVRNLVTESAEQLARIDAATERQRDQSAADRDVGNPSLGNDAPSTSSSLVEQSNTTPRLVWPRLLALLSRWFVHRKTD